MANDLVVIYVAGSMQQAYMLKNLLSEQGIQATVTNETLEKGSGVDYIGWAALPRVLVDEDDALVARRIALEHDRRGVEMAQEIQELDDEAAALPESLPEAWPRCPKCNEPRITYCPICKTTGTSFPEADDEYVWGMGLDELPEEEEACGSCCSCGGRAATTETCQPDETEPAGGSAEDDDEPAGPERLVLLCPTCSEPFVPEFPRHCAWCGHEFDDGFEPGDIVQPLPESDSRVVAVVVGLLLLAAVVVAYFALML